MPKLFNNFDACHLPSISRKILSQSFAYTIDRDYCNKSRKCGSATEFQSEDYVSRFLPLTVPTLIPFTNYSTTKPGPNKTGGFIKDSMISKINTYPADTAQFLKNRINMYHRSPFDPNFANFNLDQYPDFPNRKYYHSLRSSEKKRWLICVDHVTKAIKHDLGNKLIARYSTGKVLNSPDLECRTASDLYYRALSKYSKRLQLLDELKSTKHPEWYPAPIMPQNRKHGWYLKNKGQTRTMFYRLIKDRGKHFAKLTLPPARINHRRQVCEKCKVKCRCIWVAPFDVVVEEMGYILPFLKKQKEIDSVLFMFKSFIEGKMFKDIQHLLKDGKIAYAFDWSKFDTSIPTYIMQLAFGIFFSQFSDQIHSQDDTLWDIEDENTSFERLQNLLLYYLNTPCQLPGTTQVRIIHGGIPSGVGVTNIIGSIVNALCINYLMVNYAGVVPDFLKVQGDDSLLLVDFPLPIEKFAIAAEQKWGMHLHPDKTSSTIKDGFVSVLGHDISVRSVNRDPGKNLVSALEAERPSLTYYRGLERLVGLKWTFHIADDYYDILQDIFTHLIKEYVIRFLPWMQDQEIHVRPSEMRYIPKQTWKFIQYLTPDTRFITEKKLWLSTQGGLGISFSLAVNT